MKPVGVVMPVHNCLTYTRMAVASLVAERPLVLCLIDNASDDGTMAWGKALEALDDRPGAPRITKYIRHEENTGVAASWNEGITVCLDAGMDEVFVVNNDVVLATDTIDALLKWPARDVHFPTVYPLHLSVGQLRELGTYGRRESVLAPGDFSGFLMTRKVWNIIGPFDERYWPAYWEDEDYKRRLEKMALLHARCRDALAVHFNSRTLHEGGVEIQPFFRKNRDLYVKNWGHIKGQT